MPYRLDANHKAIFGALRGVGALVLELARFFPSPIDGIVSFRGRVFLIDPKEPGSRGKKDQGQTEKQRALVAAGWPILFPETVDEALRAIGAIVGTAANSSGQQP